MLIQADPCLFSVALSHTRLDNHAGEVEAVSPPSQEKRIHSDYATISFRIVKIRKYISRGESQKLVFHMIIIIIYL